MELVQYKDAVIARDIQHPALKNIVCGKVTETTMTFMFYSKVKNESHIIFCPI